MTTIQTHPGMGVEWDSDTDNQLRYGVVVSLPYPSPVKGFENVFLVDCTVDTFYGDPRYPIPVEIKKLRERKLKMLTTEESSYTLAHLLST